MEVIIDNIKNQLTPDSMRCTTATSVTLANTYFAQFGIIDSLSLNYKALTFKWPDEAYYSVNDGSEVSITPKGNATTGIRTLETLLCGWNGGILYNNNLHEFGNVFTEDNIIKLKLIFDAPNAPIIIGKPEYYLYGDYYTTNGDLQIYIDGELKNNYIVTSGYNFYCGEYRLLFAVKADKTVFVLNENDEWESTGKTLDTLREKSELPADAKKINSELIEVEISSLQSSFPEGCQLGIDVFSIVSELKIHLFPIQYQNINSNKIYIEAPNIFTKRNYSFYFGD